MNRTIVAIAACGLLAACQAPTTGEVVVVRPGPAQPANEAAPFAGDWAGTTARGDRIALRISRRGAVQYSLNGRPVRVTDMAIRGDRMLLNVGNGVRLTLTAQGRTMVYDWQGRGGRATLTRLQRV